MKAKRDEDFEKIYKLLKKAPRKKLTTRIIEVRRGNSYGFLLIPDTPALFKSSVIEPFKQVKAKPDKESFDILINECTGLLGGTKYLGAKPAQIKKLIEGLQDISGNIFEYNLDRDLVEFEDVLYKAVEKLEDMLRAKKGTKGKSMYHPTLVKITKDLIEYWQLMTGSKKKISAYNKGNTYGYGYGDIDVKYNAGGAFIQRTLKNYFRCNLTNLQLKRLLEKVYK
tara:strand:- start:500 stop:1174 length:675 start_codon:yes stop_codon:yes gene_type:complete